MLILALLVLAMPTSSGPRNVRYALLDARDVKAAAAQKSGASPAAQKAANQAIDATWPVTLTMMADAPPPALTAFIVPPATSGVPFCLTAPETLRLFLLHKANTIPGLVSDQEFFHVAGGKGQVSGLWDVTQGIHADIHLGEILIDHEVTSLRVIPIHTTSTRYAGGLQPGFVLGLGTSW